MRATIICPTYNHGAFIKHAIASVLRQSHQDFEIFIIGDGIPDACRCAVEESVRIDPRITFVDRPKSKRHGEEYRHEVLTNLASGEVAFYINDDDLWFPDHLASLIALLKDNDIAHCVPCSLLANGKFWFSDINWGDPNWRSWTLDPPRKNTVGLSMVCHSMDFYHRLPHGWRTSPSDEFTDHYMWKQILSMPRLRAACSGECTVLNFDTPSRNLEDISQNARLDELESWAHSMEQNPLVLRQYINLHKAIWDRSQLALGHRLHPIIRDLRERLETNNNRRAEYLARLETLNKRRAEDLARLEAMNQQWTDDLARLNQEIDKKRQRIIKLKSKLAARDAPPRDKVKPKWYRRLFRRANPLQTC